LVYITVSVDTMAVIFILAPKLQVLGEIIEIYEVGIIQLSRNLLAMAQVLFRINIARKDIG
jgi:hypothetical protein